jgi:hypothetical protein
MEIIMGIFNRSKTDKADAAGALGMVVSELTFHQAIVLEDDGTKYVFLMKGERVLGGPRLTGPKAKTKGTYEIMNARSILRHYLALVS